MSLSVLDAFAGAGGFSLGFHMAGALWRPGYETRMGALSTAAREAIPLALGAAAMLALAGLTEGWISPKPWPLMWKVLWGLGLDFAVITFLMGRKHLLYDSK